MSFTELKMMAFPYHKYCEFCTSDCDSPGYVDADYIMITNIWNERSSIEKAFQRLSKQSKIPRVWLWIDDGSTDSSSEEIQKMSEKYPLCEIWLKRMPPKEKGNLSTIGRAYDKFLPALIDQIDKMGIKYFTIQDVDTDPCPHYFERIIWIMENTPDLGACAGTVIGEEKARESGLPMGGCKVVRWSIVREIKEYWDLSPDTLLNIKALAKGYRLKIFKIPVLQDTPAFGTTKKGMFYQGRLNYYVGRRFFGVMFRALRRVLLRRYGTEMLRGYFYERSIGTWRCTDPDVIEFYGANKPWFWPILELLRTKGRYS